MVAAVNPGFTRIVLVPQGASQGASEKSGILWSWDVSLAWTVAHQVLSMKFSRQEFWSG